MSVRASSVIESLLHQRREALSFELMKQCIAATCSWKGPEK